MPNAFASLMLMLWPVVAWRLFVALPPGRALIWTFLGAYLLLPPPPAAFDFPLMPPLTKQTIPSVVAVLAALALHRGHLSFLPEHPVGLTAQPYPDAKRRSGVPADQPPPSWKHVRGVPGRVEDGCHPPPTARPGGTRGQSLQRKHAFQSAVLGGL